MKIGIVTINDDNNIGNRLQNYATQTFINTNIDNVTTETIKNTNRKGRKESLLSRFKRTLSQIKRSGIKVYFQRRSSFKSFDRNITLSNKCYDSSKNNFILDRQYDAFVVGSDQVWNPYYGWLNSIDLLSFASPEKRIAFSASFGISELPKQYHETVSKELSKFKAISVREEKGREIVEKLTRRKDVKMLVDPTMLLSASEWVKLAKRPKMLKSDKPIILEYFLGGVSDKNSMIIKSYAKKHGYQIVNITDKKSKFYACGPSEFLWLEKNAKLICTDSFHSSVFAIINERPFLVFDREGKDEKMNSRLDTLLATFELKDRWFSGEAILDDILSIDYTNTKKAIEKEKNKSIDYLTLMLGGRDE